MARRYSICDARMPLIENILQISFSFPSEWTLRDVDGAIYSCKYVKNELIVRKDNRWTGKEIFRKTFPGNTYNYMSTEAMIAHTGFRMDHDND